MKMNVNVAVFGVISSMFVPAVAVACSFLPEDLFEVSRVAEETGVLILDRNTTFSTATLKQAGVEIVGTNEIGTDGTIVFRPDEPLAVGEYEIEIVGSGFEGPTNATVNVTETPESEFSFEILNLGTERGWEGVDCCSTPIVDSCSGGSECWPTQYKYVPSVEIRIDAGAPMKFDVVMTDGRFESGTTLLTGGERKLSYLQELQDTDLCVKVTASSLDGEEVGVKEECLSPSDFPEPTREKPPEADTSECTDDPRAERPPNPDLPNPIHRSTTGCSTTSPSGTFVPLLFALLFGVRRRRKG